MHKRQKGERHSYLLLIALGTIVLAFMGLSLAITAIGTARFAVAMGYRTEVGYAVGGVFDVAKAVLPIALLMLVARRAFFFFAIIGSAWLGLVTYSGLATHATVSTAIAAIERTGTWKMEGRTNAKVELASVEQRLIGLSQPMPPRPSNSVAEALASESVPAGVWRDSRECQSIRESRYFQGACAKFLELRRELAAAEGYERLDARARELRRTLAAVPIVATSDPLPLAFAATLGHLVPLDGNAGVAVLLTLVIEIMSCFGLAALRTLREEKGRETGSNGAIVCLPQIDQPRPSGMTARDSDAAVQIVPDAPAQCVPTSSLGAASLRTRPICEQTTGQQGDHPSNVVPMQGAKSREARGGEEDRRKPPRPSRSGVSVVGSHVPEFARERLQSAARTSLGASNLRVAYMVWCAVHGHEPLSQQKLGAELRGLGFAKWKSCGLIRYRDLQLVA
jgi:hypothetical protein